MLARYHKYIENPFLTSISITMDLANSYGFFLEITLFLEHKLAKILWIGYFEWSIKYWKYIFVTNVIFDVHKHFA